jgi:hypothetical protein
MFHELRRKMRIFWNKFPGLIGKYDVLLFKRTLNVASHTQLRTRNPVCEMMTNWYVNSNYLSWLGCSYTATWPLVSICIHPRQTIVCLCTPYDGIYLFNLIERCMLDTLIRFRHERHQMCWYEQIYFGRETCTGSYLSVREWHSTHPCYLQYISNRIYTYLCVYYS